jgi:hypothetical protein
LNIQNTNQIIKSNHEITIGEEIWNLYMGIGFFGEFLLWEDEREPKREELKLKFETKVSYEMRLNRGRIW